MNMPRCLAPVFCFVMCFCAQPLPSQQAPGTVVLHEAGMPAADSPEFPQQQLQQALPGARFASAEQLTSLLTESTTRLLVLPYGSAFPEEACPSIHGFLERGGNLLVLGGRPFTRAAYRGSSGWHLRDYNVRFIRQLSIDQFQVTTGSNGLEFQNN